MTVKIRKETLKTSNWKEIFDVFDHDIESISAFIKSMYEEIDDGSMDLDTATRRLSSCCNDYISVNTDNDFEIELK